MQCQALAYVVEVNTAAWRASMCLPDRRHGLRGERGEKMDCPFSLKQASSTWSTCVPDAGDRQRASKADLQACVYSGKCVGQVPSLKPGS